MKLLQLTSKCTVKLNEQVVNKFKLPNASSHSSFASGYGSFYVKLILIYVV